MTAATGAWAAEVTVTKTVNDLFPEVANGTQKATLYSDANLSISVNPDGNNGKVYATGTEWRLYQTNSAVVTVTATDATIKSVAFTFAVKNTGVIKYDGNAMTSGTAVNVNAASAQFVVGNSGAATNGQVIISGFTVVYETTGSASGYTVSLNDGTENPTTWTASTDGTNFGALPIGGLKGDGSETVTLKYNGRLKVKSVTATSDAAPAAGKTVDLSTLTADYEAQDGDVLTNATTTYKVSIAAGATVTLDGVNISSSDYCIKCAGDATIILKDGTTNTLTGTGSEYPALSIGDANTTLTIQGSTGVLNVTSGMFCAGIGGGYKNTNSTCGNIRIEGGVITAQGGPDGAGIGSDSGGNCGDIIITGGTITAKGGSYAAGIGSAYGNGSPSVCGDITIANTVTKVTATKGENAAHSIGKGYGSKATCGTVTIGGTKYWENNAAVGDGATYLATSPLVYQPSN